MPEGPWGLLDPNLELFPIPAPNRRFTAVEFEAIKRGRTHDDHRWIFHYEHRWLNVFSQHPAQLYFRCHFRDDTHGVRIDAAFVTRDPFDLSERMADNDSAALLWNIGFALLNEWNFELLQSFNSEPYDHSRWPSYDLLKRTTQGYV